METFASRPTYHRLTMIMLGLIAFFFILDIGQDIITPLVFATILAIVLNPVVNFLTHRKVNRVLSIAVTLIAALGIIAGLIYLLSSQVAHFSDSLPTLKVKFKALLDEGIQWISGSLNVKEGAVRSWLANARAKGMEGGSSLLGSTLTTIGGVFAFVFLLPVYIFLVLFYKPLLLEFIARLFRRDRHVVVGDVLVQTKTMVQSYLIGLLLEAAIVATLNSAGLLIIGIDYAILLGVIGALLNLIPYIGGLVAITLPMLMALATKSPAAALLVVVVYLAVQFVDNNFIVPRIVASRVRLNALVSIVVVLVGGALWGVAGMFLAIPLTAILKVICDRVDELQPLGYLLGDDQPHIGSSLLGLRKAKAQKKK